SGFVTVPGFGTYFRRSGCSQPRRFSRPDSHPRLAMATTLRTLFVLGTLLLAGTSTLQAQQIGEPGRRYDDERNLIESALHTVVMVLQEATFQNTGDSISERLRQM